MANTETNTPDGDANVTGAGQFPLPTPEQLQEIKDAVTSTASSMNLVSTVAEAMSEMTGRTTGSGNSNPPAANPVPSPASFAQMDQTEQKDKIKGALRSVNLPKMVEKMANNPQGMDKAVEESAKVMTPQMMDQAKKVAAGGQGDQLRKQVLKQGMSPKQMQKDYKEQQRLARAVSEQSRGPTKRACLLDTNRKFKAKEVPVSDDIKDMAKALQAQDVVKMPYSRMAIGPLQGKSVAVWYVTGDKRRNKRIEKLLGKPHGARILISVKDEDLEVATIEEVEKLL
jgi:hypothetical protein